MQKRLYGAPAPPGMPGIRTTPVLLQFSLLPQRLNSVGQAPQVNEAGGVGPSGPAAGDPVIFNARAK